MKTTLLRDEEIASFVRVPRWFRIMAGHSEDGRSSGSKQSGSNTHLKLSQDVCDALLTCKICLEPFSSAPKSLACLHTYCEECLQKHLDSSSRSFKYSDYREISCPVCRKKTPLPTGGVRKLPDNFLLQNLKEAVGGQEGVSGAPMCDLCKHIRRKKYVLATCKCLDCAKCLCSPCRQAHTDTRVTGSHTVVDLETAEKEIACKVHEGETVRFYCDTCAQCVCVVCTFEEPHIGHEICAFSEGVSRHRARVDALLQTCRDKMETFQSHLDLTRRCSQAMKEAEESVREISQAFVQEIRQRERQIISELHEAYGDDTLDYLQHRQELTDSFQTLSKTVNLADEVSDKQVEFLLLKHDLEEKLAELGQMEVHDLPENITKRLTFRQGHVDLGRLKEINSEASSRRSSMLDLSASDQPEMVDTGTMTIGTADTRECAVQADIKVRKKVSFREPHPVSSVNSIPHREEAVMNGEIYNGYHDEEDEFLQDFSSQYPPHDHKYIRITSNQGCAVLPNGDLVVIDGDDNRLAILDKRGRFKYTFGSEQLSGGGNCSNGSQSGDIKVRRMLSKDQEGEAVNIYTPHGHTLTYQGSQKDIIISPPIGTQVSTMSRQDLFHH